MCHDVADHLIHVLALRVEVGVGVVFRDTPHEVALVPGYGPPRVLLQDGGQARGVLRPGQAGHRVTGSPGHRPAGNFHAIGLFGRTSASSRRASALARTCPGRAASVFSNSRR